MGSGFGGAVTAARLAQRGLQVLVLERALGGDRGKRSSRQPSDAISHGDLGGPANCCATCAGHEAVAAGISSRDREVIDAAVQSFRARYPQATISFSGPEEACILGWPEGLRVLIDNLLENALRHGRRPDGSVEVTVSAADGRVRLTVDDDGPGIRPEERERVFERFTRGSRARSPGSGLGLALVAQQAALHGGTAVIGDAPSGGARVTVHFTPDPPATTTSGSGSS